MVSFSCEGCGDVLTKKKLDPHRNQCRAASFTCLDCMVHFQGTEYRTHTSCISEAQKYQGALYKDKKKQNNSKAIVPHKAYVEDVDDDYHHSQIESVDPRMPEAPSPPRAVPGFTMSQEPVNVFDFLVDSETPNSSRLELAAPESMNQIEDTPNENKDRDLVRVHFDDEEDKFHSATQSLTDLISYGSGPVPTDVYLTPGPKSERTSRREKDPHRSEKKDKKRKRSSLHVETHDLSSPGHNLDEIMTDAPPLLHSGLTGGLGRLLSRPSLFPPSPDYSGGDHDASPGSPLKKTKHSSSKRDRGRGIEAVSNNIMSLITTNSHSSREHSEDRPRRKHRRHRHRSSEPRTKLLEYTPINGESISEDGDGNQMVVFQPRAELLLSFINKGPESERGVSMNKALKRYHRERNASGASLGRAEEEKELWRSLRMKQNERGEIVLFL